MFCLTKRLANLQAIVVKSEIYNKIHNTLLCIQSNIIAVSYQIISNFRLINYEQRDSGDH